VQLIVNRHISRGEERILIAVCGWGKSLIYFFPLVLWKDRTIVVAFTDVLYTMSVTVVQALSLRSGTLHTRTYSEHPIFSWMTSKKPSFIMKINDRFLKGRGWYFQG
jgi:hypothetical protein